MRRKPIAAALVFILAVVLRAGLLERHSLWADEVFSLAMATGHSLEHPTALADPVQGDYVEAPRPLPPSEYRRYLEHEQPVADLSRVIRAVRMSDTSPPLYYLLLYAWTRTLGTSDLVLRLFSLTWALACLPPLWSLAVQMGGRRAAAPTCALFAVAPLSVYYSTEGRMYSPLLFLTLAGAWLTLALWRHGFGAPLFGLWVGVGVAGLLTHYYFGFIWAAFCGYLVVAPGRLGRRVVLAGAALSGLLVVPWYAQLPESLSAWRVTHGWLSEEAYPTTLFGRPVTNPTVGRVANQAFVLLGYFSGAGHWGGGWHGQVWANRFAVVLVAALLGLLWWRLSGRLCSGRRLLVWLWLAAALAGPLAFDVLMGTYVTARPRYAIAGLPAAMLLAGLALGRLSPPTRVVALVLIATAWAPGIRDLYAKEADWEQFREVASMVDADAPDVIIVHSIPSGVLAVARYMRTETPVASWVGHLGQRRVPEDVEALTVGAGRVVLVKVHALGAPASQETWLRANAEPSGETTVQDATIVRFVMGGRERLPAPARTSRSLDN